MFSIESNSPQLPTLSVASIEPGSEFVRNVEFERLIDSILNLIFNQAGVELDEHKLKRSA